MLPAVCEATCASCAEMSPSTVVDSKRSNDWLMKELIQKSRVPKYVPIIESKGTDDKKPSRVSSENGHAADTNERR